MKKIYTLILIFASSFAMQGLFAQTNFQIAGSKVITGTADLEEATEFEVDINNTTSPAGDLFLSWTMTSNSFPSNTPYPGEWEYTLCDLGQCYNGVPAGIINMDTVHAGQHAFFKLTVTPHIVGSGILKLQVFETGNSTNMDSVEFNINSAVGIRETKSSPASFSVYPNPARDVVGMKYKDGLNAIRIVSVYDILGNQVLSYAGPKADFGRLPVAGLPRGIYIVKMQDKDGTLFSRRISLVD